MKVRFADSDPCGLAHMLGGLIQQNLDRDPGLERLLDGSVVAIAAPDAEVAVTIRLNPDIVVVSNGVAADAQVVVTASSERLLGLASAPLRFGLPDAFSRQGREVLGDVLTRRVRIESLIRNPRRLSRFTRILSVYERG
ncbi:MAG: hypothetical protein M3P11_07320 [Actinomycetota bacterium]|nr:hypothetical protein [Actinomycetota bacterium]